jgi:hypothetical protein
VKDEFELPPSARLERKVRAAMPYLPTVISARSSVPPAVGIGVMVAGSPIIRERRRRRTAEPEPVEQAAPLNAWEDEGGAIPARPQSTAVIVGQ